MTHQITIYVSDASLFEIAIKKTIQKLPDLASSLEDMILVARQDNFHFLPISHSYFVEYQNLPFFDHHRDLFDRLIIATAISENLTIISADAKFIFYEPSIQLIEA